MSSNKKRVEKGFYWKFFLLCLPITIQQLLTNSINIIDTTMVGQLGEEAIAAIGIANQYYFLFVMTIGGIAGGAGMFIAQYYGKRDHQGIQKVLSFNLILGLICGLVFFSIAYFMPNSIIHRFTYDQEVQLLAQGYLRIVAFAYPLTALSSIIGMAARGIRNTKLGLMSSSIGLLVNVMLNYGLIFGHFGFPPLGVKGAALATVFARAMELLFLLGYMYVYKENKLLRFSLSMLRQLDKSFIQLFFSKSIPIFINDVMWALGTVLYSVAYAKAGTSAIAASQIATSVGNFFIVISVSIAIGASIMIGNELGADHKQLAIDYGKLFSIMIVAIGILIGGILIIATPVILTLFNITEDIRQDVSTIFFIMGGLMWLKALNVLIVIGILRSGGDTKYALFLENGCMWLISLPITFFFATKGVPIYILFLLTYSEELAKFLLGIPRVLSLKWANNLT